MLGLLSFQNIQGGYENSKHDFTIHIYTWLSYTFYTAIIKL